MALPLHGLLGGSEERTGKDGHPPQRPAENSLNCVVSQQWILSRMRCPVCHSDVCSCSIVCSDDPGKGYPLSKHLFHRKERERRMESVKTLMIGSFGCVNEAFQQTLINR